MFLRAARTRARVLAVAALAPALILGGTLVSSAEAQPIRPDYWGMHASDWHSGAPRVSYGAANLTVSGTYWMHVESTDDVFNFDRLDQQVAAAEAARARPMVVIGRVPRHASSKPGATDYYASKPDDGEWREYVRALVSKYRARLDYQIWPEPNITQNWQGSPAEMAHLTMQASQIIRSVAPKAKIVAPAMTLRLADQQTWMVRYFKALKAKAAARGKSVSAVVDVVAIDPFPLQTGTPEDALKLMNLAKRRLAGIGVRGVAYWNNEINYGVAGGGQTTTTRYPVDVQQSYVIRTYALSAAARMQRVYWLAWSNSRELGVRMARADGSGLPPAKSYSLVRTWLNGTKFGGCQASRTGLWVCTTVKGAGSRQEVRRIYWKTKGSTTITTPRSTKRAQDQEGVVRKRRGAYRMRIDYRPVMVASRR